MSRVILALCMLYLLAISDIQSQQQQDVLSEGQQQAGQVFASQILMLANRINDYRYQTGQRDGTVPLSQIGLPFSLDARIQHQLIQGRLWIWMPEQPGLIDALRSRSRGSALTGTISGGQLLWLSGIAPGLPAPPSAVDGSVVYLN